MTHSTHQATAAPVRSLAANVLSHLASWRRRNRISLEWRDQGAGERRRLLADLGLASEDAAILYADAVTPREQLPRMASIFGVTRLNQARNAGIRRDLERVCALCPVKEECRETLAGLPTPPECNFCPNAQTLAALGPRSSA